jgi:hypothetical protein
VSPVKYERGLYIPEDDIVHSQRRENLKSYIGFQGSLQYMFGSHDEQQELGSLVLPY